MREFLGAALGPTRRNAAAALAAAVPLFVAYVLVPGPLVQYGAWLVAFTVWMGWFVAAGADYVYGEDS
ncbi:MAG: hypothetical protein ABEJ40_03750 [Haloarculaceae archaeon]